MKSNGAASAGEGIVLVIAFVSKAKFSVIKNYFDLSLVAISLIISFTEFGRMQGVGVGTIVAALLVDRWVQLYDNHVHIFDQWLPRA
ncbi:MAG: hypothetical protein Q4E64_00355 [Phascolarctobacterium sp.]|uniref:hypothetical protein n=1 Tax=Phascolarctobacterium sp. TaxID=2049039 RepID=UPI0026DBF19D|nr:hypothetical protein [Phascolarctobacterium sp.]MDO4920271.1 hypothetical protein [Phascolarctobacterium sp.]